MSEETKEWRLKRDRPGGGGGCRRIKGSPERRQPRTAHGGAAWPRTAGVRGVIAAKPGTSWHSPAGAQGQGRGRGRGGRAFCWPLAAAVRSRGRREPRLGAGAQQFSLWLIKALCLCYLSAKPRRGFSTYVNPLFTPALMFIPRLTGFPAC